MPSIPEALRTPEFQKTWDDWLADRKARGKSVTARAAELQLANCLKMGVAKAVLAINQSIERGYQGIFEPKQNFQQNGRLPGQPRAYNPNSNL